MSASSFITETYGEIRLEFLKELDGEDLWVHLWSDHLFLNLYDFWTVQRYSHLLDNYQQNNKFLKKIIRRKVKGDTYLPSYKILSSMIVEGNRNFNPTSFLEGDWGIFLNKLYSWKQSNQEDFLKIKPWLRKPKRHVKINFVCDFQRQVVQTFEFASDFDDKEKIDYIVISD